MNDSNLIEKIAHFAFCMGYVVGALKCGEIKYYLASIGVSDGTMETIVDGCDRINTRLKESTR